MPNLISEEGRDALRNYKYASSDNSWLDTHIMYHFWEYVVSFNPMNVAPNVLTFTATISVK